MIESDTHPFSFYAHAPLFLNYNVVEFRPTWKFYSRNIFSLLQGLCSHSVCSLACLHLLLHLNIQKPSYQHMCKPSHLAHPISSIVRMSFIYILSKEIFSPIDITL